MNKDEFVVNFAMKLKCIISKLWNLGETMDERDVVRHLLWGMPSKFNTLTLSVEQYGDLDKVSLNDVIGSFSVHELQLKEQESREEE